MKAYAIVIKDNPTSERGYENMVRSYIDFNQEFPLKRFDAVTPATVDNILDNTGLKWNYPWQGEVIDFATGLTKKAYQTKNEKARIACALSHYLLWEQCVMLDKPILILEHDSVFIKKIDFLPEDTGYDIIGINNPLGCTRKSKVFHDKILENNRFFQLAPYVDDDMKHPQGLAGNSAYIVKPEGAHDLIRLVVKHGLWPNDAIMCRQLIDVAVTRKFYTRVQGLPSRTTQ